MTSRRLAAALVIAGAAIIWLALASMSLPAALLALAGAVLMALGLFAVEVTP